MNELRGWEWSFDLFVELLPIVGPIFLIQLVIMIVALVSLLRKDLPMGQKIAWVFPIVFVQLLGPILYFAIGSSALDRKIAEREEKGP